MPATSHHMTREHESSSQGSNVLCSGKILHFKYPMKLKLFPVILIYVLLVYAFLAPVPVLLYVFYGWYWILGRVTRITKITEMCLCRVYFKVTSCSWSSFIPVYVLLCRAKLDGRSWFSLSGEMFYKILELMTEFSQIQAGKKVTIFIRKYSSDGELR